MIRLGVNIDHVATLRQVRGGSTPYPNILDAAKAVVKAGAHQITIHLRGDRRHIQERDLVLLTKKRPCDINLEMAATQEMLTFAIKTRPEWVCLVPEKREELTTEGGLDVAKQVKNLSPFIHSLNRKGIKCSLFIEPTPKQVWASYEVGGQAVEFHTGAYSIKTGKAKIREYKKLEGACLLAHKLGLRVHAGHGLDYENTLKIKKLPHLLELNIGHSIVCRSVFVGLKSAVTEMLRVLR